MNTPTELPAIPDRLAIAATVRDGYRCRRCDATVLEDHQRRVAVANRRAAPTLPNLILLCTRCADRHDEQQRRVPLRGGGG